MSSVLWLCDDHHNGYPRAEGDIGVGTLQTWTIHICLFCLHMTFDILPTTRTDSQHTTITFRKAQPSIEGAKNLGRRAATHHNFCGRVSRHYYRQVPHSHHQSFDEKYLAMRKTKPCLQNELRNSTPGGTYSTAEKIQNFWCLAPSIN